MIIFPVPWSATVLWTLVRQFLDPNTSEKVVLLSGAAERAAPTPASLAEHLDSEAISAFERVRAGALAAGAARSSPGAAPAAT